MNTQDELTDKAYFLNGDRVQVKHDIPNKPIMWVVDKISVVYKDKNNKQLVGMKCRWYNSNNELQEAIYSTKDLIKI